MANTNRNINYLNRDFSEFRQSLIDFTKTYFSTTYSDFSPSSPGMMIMEMAAYIGDVLSFYQDNQFQETFLQYARETNNLYELAYMFGYKPRVTNVALTNVDLYQQVPSITISGKQVPDYRYALKVNPNLSVSSTQTQNVKFILQDSVDFSYSSSLDPTTVSIYEQSGTTINTFLLKKTRQAQSSTIQSQTFDFGSPVEFSTVTINANNIVGILDVTDSDNNKWYEVDALGQESVYISTSNTGSSTDVSSVLTLLNTPRRFVTRFLNSGSLQLQFGSGTTSDTTEEIVPNANNVGLGLPFEKDKLTTAYSPTNFMFNNTYGIAPSQTTLTVRYLTGGGVASNIDSNTLINLDNQNATVSFTNVNIPDSTLANSIFKSFRVNNPYAATGGSTGDTDEDIRQNAMANFQSQLRNVTQDDYLVRTLSMPSDYGTVAKAYIEKSKLSTQLPGQTPSTLDLYILTYNKNGQLNTASSTLKRNLSTYLNQYRMVNDSVNIKDAFIINIGVEFEITVRANYNNNEVLNKCLQSLQQYFALDNWQINEPIQLKQIYLLLDQIEGVQTVKSVKVNNLVDNGYSEYAYDIEGATLNNVIYPSLDPMVFEVKFPNSDIKGRVVTL